MSENPGTATPRTVPLTNLDSAEALLTAATADDGVAPISDGLLDAAAAGDAVLVGLTAADTADTAGPTATADTAALIGVGVAALQGERWAAEAVVAPAYRGRGLGRLLVTDLAAAAKKTGGNPWFWSHGDHPAAVHLAKSAGFERARELLQLTTEAVHPAPAETASPAGASGAGTAFIVGGEPIAAAPAPNGVVLRDVRADDAEAWAAVNNAAFSWHPEQGGQDPAEYRARIEADGFDPATVVIAERTEDGRVLGFHEMKSHADHPSGVRMGEVYVIGVDPTLHARGLGRALLVEGMKRMADAGMEAIELYVESDNEKALPLYRAVGFSRTVVHVSYQPPEA